MRAVFASDATRSVIADWIELELVMSGRTFISDATVVRADEALNEPEHAETEWDPDAGEDGERLDREILESAAERRRAETWDELSHRQVALGDLYPFVLTTLGGGGWRLRLRTGGDQRVRVARWTYLAALVMASFRHHHIAKQKSDKAGFNTLEKHIAQHFQALSTFAAQNLLGEVYWFGWPRPNKKKFRQALADLIARIGAGVLREKPPKNRRKIKDGTVDIIAWRSFGDRTYGSMLLYGQVASGSNWRTKPVKAYLRGQFLDHFYDLPSSQYLGATFIPFLLYTDLVTPPDGDMAAALVDEARQLEKDYGVVVDRLRLTELVGQGVGDKSGRHNCPDPCFTMLALVRWVRDCRLYCDQAA